jgi:L-ribulose-5-phosphate 4-epimerase
VYSFHIRATPILFLKKSGAHEEADKRGKRHMLDEGYIKFSLTLEDAPPPLLDSRLSKLNSVRTKLHDLGLIGVLPDGIGYGNVSIRTGDTIVISGSATGEKLELNNTDYSEVLEADINNNSLVCRGKINASSESMSHWSIYNADEAIQCVIHIHSELLYECLIHHHVPETPVEAEYGTPDIAHALYSKVKEIGNTGIIVMRGHKDGIIAFSPTIEETYRTILKWNNICAGEC